MDKKIARAQKRKCFHGRGALARWTDRLFFAGLGGLCLYIVLKNWWLSITSAVCLLSIQMIWAKHRWESYQKDLRKKTSVALRKENWLKEEAVKIRSCGETILFPLPGKEQLSANCLNADKGTRFHCFGDEDKRLCEYAKSYGCILVFHPWGMGKVPTNEDIENRIAEVSDGSKNALHRIISQTYNRYFLTGACLLLFSITLRHAVYWRLLASLCFIIGAVKRLVRIESI